MFTISAVEGTQLILRLIAATFHGTTLSDILRRLGSDAPGRRPFPLTALRTWLTIRYELSDRLLGDQYPPLLYRFVLASILHCLWTIAYTAEALVAGVIGH